MTQTQVARPAALIGRPVSITNKTLQTQRATGCLQSHMQRIGHSNAAFSMRSPFSTSAAATAEPAADAPAEEHQYQAEVHHCCQ